MKIKLHMKLIDIRTMFNINDRVPWYQIVYFASKFFFLHIFVVVCVFQVGLKANATLGK